MKVSLKWLKEFIDFGGMESEKIANFLNNRTMEVEKIIPYSRKSSFKNIVVGEIKSISAHPSNDNFGVAEVYAGESLGIKRIVFTRAGLEISTGEKVLIATKGAVFENGLKIRDKSIFGVVSEAAFCSEKDLGLDLNISSIVRFPEEEIGRSAYDIFEFEDTVLEFDLEPNRPDLFGILGFAFELSAITGGNLKHPAVYNDMEINPGGKYSSLPDKLNVSVEDKSLSASYIAVKIDNIKISESSSDIKNKLIKCGVRPVNNIVDLTNLVMLETSQPLHAFDASKTGREIRVAAAGQGETVTTLDGRERKMEGGEILIKSGDTPVALAGIMGGLESGIGESTNSIIVESANFDMSRIRKASRTLALRTDASTRFEKGIHPSMSILGIKRFIYLLKKYYPEVRIESFAYDMDHYKDLQVYNINYRDMADFSGCDIDGPKIFDIVSSLGYSVKDKTKEGLSVTPPLFRSDISNKVDIYEDIFRIYGYENIKSTIPYGILYPPAKNKNFETSGIFRNILSSAGFIEIINTSLVGEKDIKIAGTEESEILELKNPISVDHAYFRTSLIPGILRCLSNNMRRYENIKIFEIGKVYHNINTELSPVSESNFLCGLVSGGKKFGKPDTEFYSGKSLVEYLLKESGVRRFSLSGIEEDNFFDGSVSMAVNIGKERIGIFGEIKKVVAEEFKIDSKAFVFVIDIEKVKNLMSAKKSFTQPPKYPAVEQDISIICGADIEYGAIEKAVKNFSGMIKNVRLVDIYKGKQVGDKKISFLIRYDAYSPEKTLTMAEVNELRDNIIKHLNEKYGIVLRS